MKKDGFRFMKPIKRVQFRPLIKYASTRDSDISFNEKISRIAQYLNDGFQVHVKIRSRGNNPQSKEQQSAFFQLLLNRLPESMIKSVDGSVNDMTLILEKE